MYAGTDSLYPSSFRPLNILAQVLGLKRYHLDTFEYNKYLAIYSDVIWSSLIIYFCRLVIVRITNNYEADFINITKTMSLFGVLLQVFDVFFQSRDYKDMIRINEELKSIEKLLNKLGIMISHRHIRNLVILQLITNFLFLHLIRIVCLLLSGSFTYQNIYVFVKFIVISTIRFAVSLNTLFLVNYLLLLLHFRQQINKYIENWVNNKTLILYPKRLKDNYKTLKIISNTINDTYQHVIELYSWHIIINCFYIFCFFISNINVILMAKADDTYKWNLFINLFVYCLGLISIIFVSQLYRQEFIMTDIVLQIAKMDPKLHSIKDKLEHMQMELIHLSPDFECFKMFDVGTHMLTEILDFGVMILITALERSSSGPVQGNNLIVWTDSLLNFTTTIIPTS